MTKPVVEVEKRKLHDWYQALGPSIKLELVASKCSDVLDSNGVAVKGKATCDFCIEGTPGYKKVRQWAREKGNNAQKHFEGSHWKEWVQEVEKKVCAIKAKHSTQARLQFKHLSGSKTVSVLQKSYNVAKMKADIQWAINVCAYDLPLSLGEKQGVRDWIDLLRQVPNTLSSRYTAPVSKTLKKYFPSIKSSIKAQALKSWHEALDYYDGPFAALESDIWKDSVGVNWLGAIVHYLSPTGVQRNIFLGMLEIKGSHTADSLVEWHREMIGAWGLLDPRQGTHFDVILAGSKLGMKEVFYSGTPDNASNVMKAMRNTAVVVNGCMAHKLNLCLKNALVGKFITAVDMEREVFGEGRGLQYEEQDRQLELLERIINQDADLEQSLREKRYDPRPIKDLVKNIACRALYFSTSTKAGDKLALAQEAAGEEVMRVITNNKTRWIGLYKMAKRDDLIDGAVATILEDPLENAPGGLWGDAKGKLRKTKCRCPPHMKTMRRQLIGILRPLMQAQIDIQLRFQSLADANELIQVCKYAMLPDTTTDIQITSGTNQTTEAHTEDDLLPEMKAMRVRLRDLLFEYFPLKPSEEVLVSYYLHCMHKDMSGLELNESDTNECIAIAKGAVTQRAVSLLENERLKNIRRNPNNNTDSSDSNNMATDRSSTPQNTTQAQTPTNTTQANTDNATHNTTLDYMEETVLSPKSKRRRKVENRRSGLVTPSDVQPNQQEYIIAMKKKIAAEVVIWESLGTQPSKHREITIGRGCKCRKTKTVEMDPTEQNLEYWKEHKVQMPTLYMVALCSLTVLPTSCRTESIFSLAGNVQNDTKKGSFSEKTFEEICFIKGN